MKRMKFTTHICASVVFSALAVTSVQAQDAGALIQGWSGTASLGANSIQGNSEANNISADIRLGRTIGRWEHIIFGSYFKGDATTLVEQEDENGNVITQTIDGEQVAVLVPETSGNSDRLAVGWQPRFYWRPRTYFFGILDYEQDEPANIDLASRQLIGVGHKFFSNESGFLSGEAGVGNRVTEQVIGDDLTGGVAYFGLNYLNRINDNVTFNADFRADVGDENTYTELGLGLAFKVSERLAVKLSHQTRGNTDIENPLLASPSSTDSVTSFNLVFDI